jgi:hypothetical protein
MFAAFTWKRFQVVVAMILIACAAIWVYEFRVLQRPRLSKRLGGGAAATAGEASTVAAAPAFGLAKVSFACAAEHGFVTAVRVNGATTVAECGNGFTEATTRCASSFPMMGFGDGIMCAAGEEIRCAGKPLQAIGLFKGDSYCGDASDRDTGPPGVHDR